MCYTNPHLTLTFMSCTDCQRGSAVATGWQLWHNVCTLAKHRTIFSILLMTVRACSCLWSMVLSSTVSKLHVLWQNYDVSVILHLWVK